MRPPRITIGRLMLVVALLGLVAWGVAMRRRWDLHQARLAAVQRAEDRLEWAERMRAKGYVSQAQVESDRVTLLHAKGELGQ